MLLDLLNTVWRRGGNLREGVCGGEKEQPIIMSGKFHCLARCAIAVVFVVGAVLVAGSGFVLGIGMNVSRTFVSLLSPVAGLSLPAVAAELEELSKEPSGAAAVRSRPALGTGPLSTHGTRRFAGAPSAGQRVAKVLLFSVSGSHEPPETEHGRS